MNSPTQTFFARFVHPVALWVSLLLLVGALRDQYSLVSAFDTGLYLQWLYGFWSDGSLASSVTGESNFLAHHFQPSMLVFAPLVAAFGRPLILFILAAAALATTWWLGRRIVTEPDSSSVRWYNAVFVIFAAHPALAGRVWYSFAPDILALPAFFWMAITLSRPREEQAQSAGNFAWIAAFIWAGLAKETFWLTNVFVAMTAAVLVRERRIFFAVAAAIQVAVFAGLFLKWMPSHTQMPSYYGLRFYLDIAPGASVSLTDFALACLRNFFSLRTPETLGWLILLTCGIPFLRFSAVWFAALPGLMMILLAKQGQLHHPANHYLIPVLPFIMAPAFFAQDRYHRLWTKLGRGISPSFLALIPAGFCFVMTGGMIEQLMAIRDVPGLAAVREDVQVIKIGTAASTPLIVDGSLQPLFYDFPDVTVLLGHVGNPRQRPVTGNSEALTIVTSVDLKHIPDCAGVRIGGPQLVPDYAYFLELCTRVKSSAETVRQFPDSGLTVYRLPP